MMKCERSQKKVPQNPAFCLVSKVVTAPEMQKFRFWVVGSEGYFEVLRIGTEQTWDGDKRM